jgi:hypothetical protein
MTTRCGCRTGRTLDQLLMDYLLFGDQTAADDINTRAKELRSGIRTSKENPAAR